MSDKTKTIQRLLAKAERASTIQEAEAFRAKATELMLKYSIDEAVLSAAHESSDTLGSRRIVIAGGYAKAGSILLTGIGDAFSVKVISVARGAGGTVCMVYGWESDLAMVEVLFASLQVQAMREAKMTHAQNRHINGRTWTTSFLIGFANTIWTRLKDQRAKAVRDTGDSTGTELAIVDRSKAVDVAYRTAHPRTSKAQSSTVRARSGFYSGQAAGQRADIGNTRVGGSRVALTR
jgi:hypothetical protein